MLASTGRHRPGVQQPASKGGVAEVLAVRRARPSRLAAPGAAGMPRLGAQRGLGSSCDVRLRAANVFPAHETRTRPAGPPLGVFAVATGAAPAPATAEARLWLPADAMYALRLPAGAAATVSRRCRRVRAARGGLSFGFLAELSEGPPCCCTGGRGGRQ